MRLPFCLLLLSCALPLHAQWTPVDGSEKSYDYVDWQTLRAEGDLRRVWTLHDLLQRDKDGDMSYRNHLEYDCAGGRYRSLQSLFYAGSMATGRLTGRSEAPSPWRVVSPGTIGATVMRSACSRTGVPG